MTGTIDRVVVAYDCCPPARPYGTAYPPSEGALRGAALGATAGATCIASLIGDARVFETLADAFPSMVALGLLAGIPGAALGAGVGAVLALLAHAGAPTALLRLLGGLAAGTVSLWVGWFVGQVALPVLLLAVLWGSLGAVWVSMNPAANE